MSLDFKVVAAAALAMSSALLAQWLGGRAHGREWKAERRVNGGLGDSWSVNLDTGAWIHGGGDERGGDLISLYAALHHIDQLAALNAVAQLCGVQDGRPAPIHMAAMPAESPAEEIPPDAPPIPEHKSGLAPTAVYRYWHDFVVCRYDTPTGKTFAQLTWRRGRWQWKAHAAPRPLYGRELLVKHPDAPVLVVEGERCADAARLALKRYVVITWAGGAGAVRANDWEALKDRDVLLWPDADAPGRQAMARLGADLAGRARRLRIIEPAGQPEGWDIADAIADGWSASQIVDWAAERLVDIAPPAPEPAPTAPQDDPPADPPGGQLVPVPSPVPSAVPSPAAASGILADRDFNALDSDVSAVAGWHALNLDRGENGQPHPTLANASAILQYHEHFKGRIWLDTFRAKIFTSLRGAPSEWCDSDTRSTTAFIQHQMRLSKFSSAMVHEAVMHAAESKPRNSLQDWLKSLQWDGVSRLDDWLIDSLGLERTPYTLAVSRNWPISMVARAFVPGCQVDTMVVLEGPMGRGKSSFLAALGGEWFASVSRPFGDKEFLQDIQGVWLVEIPDMTGFGRREHSQILATVTVRSDRYRQSYGRFVEDHPRKCVFAATSEQDDYLQETRGRRRFWPLRCTDIDLDVLAGFRDQVFAEATQLYNVGAHWYEMPEETDAEQLDRASQDLWHDRVVDYCESVWLESKTSGRPIAITSTNILNDAIDMPLAKQTDGEKRRIAKILTGAGWIQKRDGIGRFWKKIIR